MDSLEVGVGMLERSLKRGDGALIRLPAFGVENRGACCIREVTLDLLAAGMREDVVDAFFALNVVLAGAAEGSSSSTITQFFRSSSPSLRCPVCLRFAVGRSGVVSGDGSFSRNGLGAATGLGLNLSSK